ncbi:MAG: 30S ribosomal protein S9 [Candidatus Eisenbacteria bacterium]|uniref:Small ribosomal subunit protein uS9 n=1 Tax=Eiseniibacteriota bacterium TaxID=2212470 RepID=A0A956NC40_UNCEI|nr:30S ribosomal protein S9 [Candidatus Eisenbacteria bacterium]MCB9462964.1 30S ribosomal protein S9 [Candidatus Eisenbacteria bacterium]
MATKTAYLGTGRRKSSVARVRIMPGSGKKLVNGRPLEEYFAREVLVLQANRPLVVTEMDSKVDITARVDGGGVAGQAGAVSLGIARALKEYDLALKSALDKESLLTRDPRMKERKKYGQPGARKRFQFSKR